MRIDRLDQTRGSDRRCDHRYGASAIGGWLLTSAALGMVVFCAGCGCDDSGMFQLPDPAVRYIAFGDSSTSGPSERDYVTYLPGLLNIGADAFANEGEDGETTEEGLGRLGSILSRELYPNAMVLLYWEGGKDLIAMVTDLDPLLFFSPNSPTYPYSGQLDNRLDEIQANIEAAIRLAKREALFVFVATYFFLPAGSLDCDPLFLDILLPGQAVNANAYVTLLNERIRQAAQNENAMLIDVAAKDPELRGDPGNYYNCNHLSASGNEIVAGLFFEAILE